MRPSLTDAAAALRQAQDTCSAGHLGRGKQQLEHVLELLQHLRPTPERDNLLAQVHLDLYLAAQLGGQQGRGERHLRWGVSYARTAGDGPTRSHAQQLWDDWRAQRA